MDQYGDYRITCEFEYQRQYYIAFICPYYELSEYEMRLYNIAEYVYVVHLFSLTGGFKTFEIFPGRDHNWITNASQFFVGRDIVGIISYVLMHVFR